MNTQDKIQKLKNKMSKQDKLKLTLISGTLTASSFLMAQNTKQPSQDKNNYTQEILQSQNNNKDYSMVTNNIDANEFMKKNNIPFSKNFQGSFFYQLDNNLILSTGINLETDEFKVEIFDKDENGKLFNVTDKYLKADKEYSLVPAPEDNNVYITDLDETEAIVFHKDKSSSTINIEDFKQLNKKLVITPKCLIIRENEKAFSEKELQNRHFFAPHKILETMILPDGKKIKLPSAFVPSHADENGNLITYPITDKERHDFCQNGLFKEDAEQKLQAIDYETLGRLCTKTEPFKQQLFRKFNTSQEQEAKNYMQKSLQEISEDFNIDNIYNFDNLRKFCNEHQKIVTPSNTLQLTPQHFQNLQHQH